MKASVILLMPVVDYVGQKVILADKPGPQSPKGDIIFVISNNDMN